MSHHLECLEAPPAAVVACALLGLLIVMLPGTAPALPTLSVDVDPLTPDIQSTLTVSLGSGVTVDIVISNVDAAEPLQAYELDLDFDSAVLTATSVADAGFLLGPVQTVEADIAPPDVNLLATTVGLGGASGSGVLAQLTFDATALGLSPLNLNDVKLAAPFGVPISLAGINDASIQVVPEPSTGILLVSGLLLLSGRRSRGARATYVRLREKRWRV